MLEKNLLAREGFVVSTITLEAVCVANVVSVLLVELVFANTTRGEGGTPKGKRFLDAEADSLEEERVLKAAEMLEMLVAAESLVEVDHAGGEMCGEGVDRSGGDRFAGENSR